MSGILVHIPLHLRIQFHDWNSVSNSLKVYYEDNNMTIQNQFSKIIVLIDAEIAEAVVNRANEYPAVGPGCDRAVYEEAELNELLA